LSHVVPEANAANAANQAADGMEASASPGLKVNQTRKKDSSHV
jgi:hypothetical protein